MRANVCPELTHRPDPRQLGRREDRTATSTRGLAAPAADHHRSSPERYYVGRRRSSHRVYVVDRAAVEPLAHPRYRSAAAFDWGRPTDGALELAFALLSHASVSDPPEPICRVFCEEVVCMLPPDGFVIARGDVALWLLAALEDAGSDWPAFKRPAEWRLIRWIRRVLGRAAT